MKIKFQSNNIFPTNKSVDIHLATIIIRAIFIHNDKYYPQLFLDDGLHKYFSGGIDVDMSDKSEECMLCHYWYFLDKNFSYGPYLCDKCYNMIQKCNKLKNIAISRVKEKNVYRIFFLYMSKREAKKLMTNLIDKKVFYKLFFSLYKNE